MTMETKQPQQPKKIRRAGSITVTQHRYEQIQRNDDTPAFLVYEHGTYSYYVSFPDQTDNGIPITIIPMSRLPWKSCGPVPSIVLEQDELWSKVRKFVYDHVDFDNDHLYDVVTAWIFASWIPEVWRSISYLFFMGAVASGKTRALEILLELCYRAIMAPNISGPALYRGIEEWHPTLLLDETEIYNKDQKSDVLGVLNAGYRRGQYVVRVVKSGDDFELGQFDVFSFKALAGTQSHRKTLESRSIIIPMFKTTRQLRFMIDTKRGQHLRTQLLLWRLRVLSEYSERGEESERFQEQVPLDLQFADGRFVEKYFPLYMVANKARESILAYAKHAYQRELDANDISIEAEVAAALQHCEALVENCVVKLKDITEAFNEGKPEKERWKSRSVGAIMRRLGFNYKRATGGDAGFVWDEDILQRNLRRYRLLDILLSDASSSSLSSLPTPSNTPDTPFKPPPNDPDAQVPLNIDAIMCNYSCYDCTEWRGITTRCAKQPGQLILPTARYPKSCTHFSLHTIQTKSCTNVPYIVKKSNFSEKKGGCMT